MKRKHRPSDVHKRLLDRARNAMRTAATTKNYRRRIAAEARADAYITAAEMVRRYLGRKYKKQAA
jgi:hypothetical protein